MHTDGDSVYFSVVKSQYTVVYNVNGGTGGVASQTKTYGKPLTLSTAVPAKENDIFIGWGTEDNPTVVQYQPGDTYAADSDVVLVAVWKQDLHPTIAVDTISGKPGETVTVPVYMTENPGIIAARLKISYDPNLLKLIFVSDGNILGAHQFGEDLTVNPYIVSWSNGDAAEDYVANGALVYLIFEIAEDAPAGEFAITVSYDPAEIYNKDLTNVTFDVQQGVVEVTHEDMPEAPNEEPKGGCYIATCVYGSYDCSEVWTLRRFRDNTLASTWAGRAFIRTYYAVSPTLVEWFGEADWFRTMWKGMLDVLVDVLNGLGVADTAYEDKAW